MCATGIPELPLCYTELKVIAASSPARLITWTISSHTPDLRILDRICGPEPPTPADEQHERDHERLRKAFPKVDIDGQHRS